jgi:hypothetical protein
VPPDATKPETAEPRSKVGNPDWSPWVLLLIPPILIPLLPGLFNRATPELFGMPAFYWMQLAFVPMSALFTGLVYLKTRKR